MHCRDGHRSLSHVQTSHLSRGGRRAFSPVLLAALQDGGPGELAGRRLSHQPIDLRRGPGPGRGAKRRRVRRASVTWAAVVLSWRQPPVVLVFSTLAAGEGELGFVPASFQVDKRSFGAWRSLVARSVRDRKAGGSNPLAPTTTIVFPALCELPGAETQLAIR